MLIQEKQERQVQYKIVNFVKTYFIFCKLKLFFDQLDVS